jgi:hypothetical protein
VTEVPKPLDTALDLLVYAPVGVAMTVAEELPKMAAKGRSRVTTQLTMARVVGQFAVTKGRQEVEKRLAPPAPSRTGSPGAAPPASEVQPVSGSDEMTGEEPPANGKSEGAAAGPVPADRPLGAGWHVDAPPAGTLAIPGYDSLAASQVVQRLAGLSGEELAEVGLYERAHRGRRTILNRIDQLQGL